jgi:hypothetical protein
MLNKLISGVRTIGKVRYYFPVDKMTMVQLFEQKNFEINNYKVHDVYLIEVKKLLFNEPLERVPLYINDFPELARWRLRIGK